MRFREVFRYEFGYRLRSPATWAYAAFLFLVTGWGLVASADGSAAVNANAPQGVATGIVLFGGLFGMLVSAALFADAAIRDVAAGMDPLLYTTRLRKAEYLGGRFLAALATNAIVALAIPLGFFVATVTLVEADAVGPFRLAAYVQPVLLLLLPNIVLSGAVLFTIAVLARQVIPVYLGAIGIFISYIVAANYWSSIQSPMVATLADPLAINAFLARTRYWTAVELETRLIGFPALLLWNRVLWLAVATGLLAVLHRRFRFGHTDGGGRRRKRRQVRAEAPVEARWTGAVPQIVGSFGLRTRWRQTLAVAQQSLAEVLSGRAFQVAFVGAIGLVLLWGWNVGDTVFDTSTRPVTQLVVAVVLGQRSIFIPWLVIALYAGELVWKDREVGAAEIADTIPVPTAIMLLGRFLALLTIIVIFHAGFMVGGVALQALHGYYVFELGLYLRVLFGLSLADHVLLGALAMAVHVLVNQKYLGYTIVLLACVFGVVGRGMEFPPLLVYNSSPGWTYSDMNGFGPFLAPFVWFKLYWAAWALLLGAVTILFWVRGREPGMRRRIAEARARLRGPTARLAGVATVLILALGGFIFYNTNILNDNPARNEVGRAQAEYERRYGQFEDAPQPVITAADLRLEVYPDTPAVDMRGSYMLVNRTGVALDAVHVVIDTDVDTRALSLDRAARPVVVDAEAGYRIFALDQALQPGDTLRLSFDVRFRPRGFPNSGIQTAVVGNGTYFDRRLLPFVGYQPAFELTDAVDREHFGLAPQPLMAGPDDAAARQHDDQVRGEDRVVQVEAVVGTAADQIVVAPGTLRRSWTENGRRYFHYGTDVPGPFATSVFSAKYAVAEGSWNDVALQVYYHPGHPYNPERMIESMQQSLAYYTRTFGPYQYKQLRIVEIPPYSINGRALPTTIAFAEQNFITHANPGGVDFTFFGTAHEVAHSWWGGQLRGAFVRGGAVLSEALANYSAMLVTEQVLGPEQARRVYDYQMDRYLSRRAAFERDVPLIEVEDHPHIAYGKGAVAMYTLRDYLGDDVVNAALRRFLEQHRAGGPPYPTARDLVAELRAVTPDELQYLITDLFETITLWDVRTTRADVERTAGGAYQVTLDVVAQKLRADSVGRETETPMDDFVEIGVFAPGAGDDLGAPLYLQRHRIHSGAQTIRVTVPREPARAGIDPWRKLIDRERADNVVAVTVGGADPGGAGQ